jgi:hypothetical protein
MATTDQTRVTFYLVKDGDRELAVAVDYDGRLLCFVPNVDAFIYNKPLTVDFQIDRTKTYDDINVGEASRIIAEGRIGRIDDRDGTTLMEWASSEPHRVRLEDVLDSWGLDVTPDSDALQTVADEQDP